MKASTDTSYRKLFVVEGKARNPDRYEFNLLFHIVFRDEKYWCHPSSNFIGHEVNIVRFRLDGLCSKGLISLTWVLNKSDLDWKIFTMPLSQPEMNLVYILTKHDNFLHDQPIQHQDDTKLMIHQGLKRIQVYKWVDPSNSLIKWISIPLSKPDMNPPRHESVVISNYV